MRISTHAPARGATEGAKAYYNVAIISTHAPTGGATTLKALCTFCALFQSTLPRGERLNKHVTPNCPQDFNPRSHGGSDSDDINLDNFAKISIHAPTGGATISFPLIQIRSRFQSTLPRGERLPLCYRDGLCKQFQSTLPRGERPEIILQEVIICSFQSTLPRGERQL